MTSKAALEIGSTTSSWEWVKQSTLHPLIWSSHCQVDDKYRNHLVEQSTFRWPTSANVKQEGTLCLTFLKFNFLFQVNFIYLRNKTLLKLKTYFEELIHYIREGWPRLNLGKEHCSYVKTQIKLEIENLV